MSYCLTNLSWSWNWLVFIIVFIILDFCLKQEVDAMQVSFKLAVRTDRSLDVCSIENVKQFVSFQTCFVSI
jgi:hypothetical protein